MSEPPEILFNAFAMNTVGHLSPGQWTIPRDRTGAYNRLRTWTDLAQTLERGLFDGLFIADVVGVYDIYGGGPDAALRHAAQLPINDPMMLVSAMAHVTRHLGFGVTANLTWTSPFLLARLLHAGSPDRRADRLEHRDRLPRQRRPRAWACQPDRA